MTRLKVRLNLEKYLQPMIEKEIQAVIKWITEETIAKWASL